MSLNSPNDNSNNSGEASSPPSVNSSPPDFGNKRRRVTIEEVDRVRVSIERCIQAYMNMNETMDFLSANSGIEPIFTEMVWKKLEEDNPEFFTAYYIRLEMNDEIRSFNQSLRWQYATMNSHNIRLPTGSPRPSSGCPCVPVSNIPFSAAMPQNVTRGFSDLNIPVAVPVRPRSTSDVSFQPNMPTNSGRNAGVDLNRANAPPRGISSENDSLNSANMATPGRNKLA